MLLPKTDNFAKIDGAIDSLSFEVGESGLIIEYLRDKIYTDPIKAICREIACNARDAHREVGTPDLPIEIKLPSALDLTIKFKDNGPGISPERMSDIFVKFGNSTKRATNDQTGAWGLGGKSPFAYTDSFSVETIFEGTKYVWNGVIDETRAGKMVLLHKEETSEPNGTTIIVPVRSQDISEFAREIVDVTTYWKVRPKLSGCKPLPQYPEIETRYSGDKWRIESVKVNGYPRARSLMAIIDGIAYHINSSIISSRSIDYPDNYIAEAPLVLEFDNGDLSLSISRDSIHLDDKTKTAIIERVKSVVSELKVQINNSIAAAPNYKKACSLYSELTEFLPRQLSRSWFEDGMSWNGMKLQSSISIEHIGPWATIAAYWLTIGGELKYSRASKEKNIHFQKDDLAIYHNDLNKNIKRNQIKWLLESSKGINKIKVITTPEVPSTEEWRRALEKDKNLKTQYDFKLLDAIEAKKLSKVTFPKLAPLPRERREKKENHIHGYTLSINRWSNKIVNKPVNVHDVGGVYVRVDYRNNTCFSGGKYVDPEIFSVAQNILGREIFGFSEKRTEKLSPHWEQLHTVLEEKIDEILLTKCPMSVIRKIVNSDKKYHWSKFEWIKSHSETLGTDSVFVKLYKKFDEIDTLRDKFMELIPVMRWIGKYDISGSSEFKDLTKIIYDRYPLFSMIEEQSVWGIRSKKMQDKVIDYIRSMDRLRELETTIGVEEKLELKSA